MAEATDPIQTQLATLRRSQILEAAIQVFAERGFHRTTIRDIAKVAGIADGTIYNYFDNKEELLLGILDRLNESEQRPAHFAQAETGDFHQFLVTYLEHRLSLLWANRDVLRSLLPELLVNPNLCSRYVDQVLAPTLQLGEQHFQTLIQQGKLRPLDAALIARAIAGMLLGVLIIRLLGDEHLSSAWAQTPAAIADLLENGLGNGE